MNQRRATIAEYDDTHCAVSGISLAPVRVSRPVLPSVPNTNVPITPHPVYQNYLEVPQLAPATAPPTVAAPPTVTAHKPIGETKQRRRSVENLNTRPRKKTVAFGRTVNVSQTVEGTKTNQTLNTMPKSAKNETILLELKAIIEKQGDEIKELQKTTKTISGLEEVVRANLQQISTMTETLNQVLLHVQSPAVPKTNGRVASPRKKNTVAQQLRQRPSSPQLDQENVQPQKMNSSGRMEEDIAVDGARVQQLLIRAQKMFDPKGSKQSAEDDGCWSMLRAKADQNPELREKLGQLAIEYATDDSLINLNRRVARPHTEPRARQSNRTSPPMSPLTYRTTRRLMTLAEEVTCVDSPPKSNVYSRGTLGFMERNGLRGRRNNAADRHQQAPVRFEQLDDYSDDDYHTPPQRYHVREYDDDEDEDEEALLHRRDSAVPREMRRYVRR